MADPAVDNAFAWDRLAAWYVERARLPTDVAHYGLDAPTEADLRLCGDLRGKRVLELGCGAAQNAIAFARAGARVIAVDASAGMLAQGRQLAEDAEVRVEFHHGDLADLGFITSASIDLVFSAMAFGFVDDLARVFRQVHRVLKTGSAFVFSLPHPLGRMVEGRQLTRSYWDTSPLRTEINGVSFTEYQHTVSAIVTQLLRASFRVDTLLEPEPPATGARSMLWDERWRMVPPVLILRARKEGI